MISLLLNRLKNNITHLMKKYNKKIIKRLKKLSKIFKRIKKYVYGRLKIFN
jgi:hypothetical protein